MNRLIPLSLLSLFAAVAAGCGSEARVTGPTQCFAPHDAKLVRAARELVQAKSDLSEHTAFDTATF